MSIIVKYNKFNTEIEEATIEVSETFKQVYTIVESPQEQDSPIMVKTLRIVGEDSETGSIYTQELNSDSIKELQLLLNQLTRQLNSK